MGAAQRIGAEAQIQLSELSLSRPLGEPKIMAAMTGYFDDSRSDGQVLTVAGLVGDETQWQEFERTWPLILKRHAVPYFHMREMSDPSGVFAKWLPHRDHVEEVRAFFVDIVEAIGGCKFGTFGAIVRIQDLARFNSEKSLSLEPYALAVYAIMLQIRRGYPNMIVSLIFDHIEQVFSRLEKAIEYAKDDPTYPGAADYIQPIPLPKACTFRNVRPIQAADFVVWEIRKHHIQQNEWWELKDLPSDWNARFEHYQAWSRRKHGTRLPPARKSLGALATRVPLQGIVLDYRGLCLAHEARGGIWSQASSEQKKSF